MKLKVEHVWPGRQNAPARCANLKENRKQPPCLVASWFNSLQENRDSSRTFKLQRHSGRSLANALVSVRGTAARMSRGGRSLIRNSLQDHQKTRGGDVPLVYEHRVHAEHFAGWEGARYLTGESRAVLMFYLIWKELLDNSWPSTQPQA